MLRSERGSFIDTKLNDAQRYQIICMYADGVLLKLIAHTFNVSPQHVEKMAKRVGLRRNKPRNGGGTLDTISKEASCNRSSTSY